MGWVPFLDVVTVPFPWQRRRGNFSSGGPRGQWAFLASDSTPALAVLVRDGKEKKQGGQGFS